MDFVIKLTPVEEIAGAIQNVYRTAQQFLAPTPETLDHAAAFAKLVTEVHVNLQRRVQDCMAQQQLFVTRMADMVAVVAQDFEHYRKQEEPDTCKLLSDAGWLGMDRHFCLQHLRETALLYRTQGEAAMNEAIVHYFNQNGSALLVAISESWLAIPYFSDRKDIVRDAVNAHKEAKFTLSIPALLPLIDGLSAEILGNQSKNAIPRLVKKRRYSEPEVWAQGFCDFVEDVYYMDYKFGKDIAPFLSRHGILHGRVSDYPSVLNSTKVFLLIDELANMWYEKQNAIVPTNIQ